MAHGGTVPRHYSCAMTPRIECQVQMPVCVSMAFFPPLVLLLACFCRSGRLQVRLHSCFFQELHRLGSRTSTSAHLLHRRGACMALRFGRTVDDASFTRISFHESTERWMCTFLSCWMDMSCDVEDWTSTMRRSCFVDDSDPWSCELLHVARRGLGHAVGWISSQRRVRIVLRRRTWPSTRLLRHRTCKWRAFATRIASNDETKKRKDGRTFSIRKREG